MKKILIIILIILLASGGYYYYNNIYLKNQKPTIEVEKNTATITKYYIYGTHLNIIGNIKKIDANFKDVDLVFWNEKTGKTIKQKLNYTKNVNNLNFNLSDEINDGLFLDKISEGTYRSYLRFTYKDKKTTTTKYYALTNKTDYKSTKYYTLSNKNNKINITTKEQTLTLKVTKNKDKTYDVILDPQAGGSDKGNSGNGHYEKDITMDMATKVKEKLEAKKIKVKLTREADLSDSDYVDEYNEGGRAVISHELNSKYLFSFQTTRSSNAQTNGFSIYTAVGINYDFAAKMVENIINKTNLKTSTTTYQRVDYGIYSHNFTESEIKENMTYYENKGYKPYNVTTDSNYLYMIRETGGIITGAYIDDSNPDKVGVNPYYKSNIGTESYVISLGYLTNQTDITAMTTNIDAYASAIADSIIKELKY